jgi:hypothetical protein
MPPRTCRMGHASDGNPGSSVRLKVLRGRIDISQDMEGGVVVLACIDLGEEEAAASAHAVRVFIEERFRLPTISGDDVLELRELTAVADELGAPASAGAVRTLVFNPARLNLYRDALTSFVDSRDEAGWVRDEDRGPLARVRPLLPELGELSKEAVRAAHSPVPRVG